MHCEQPADVILFGLNLDQIIAIVVGLLSAIAGIAAVYIAFHVHKNEHKWEKRKLVIDVIDRFVELRHINPVNPSSAVVWSVFQALSTAATIYELKMVDREELMYALAKSIVLHYEELLAVGSAQLDPQSNRTILDELSQEERIERLYNVAKKLDGLRAPQT